MSFYNTLMVQVSSGDRSSLAYDHMTTYRDRVWT